MELLIGAGRRRDKAFGGQDWRHLVTLDLDPATKPDVQWDLNRMPLPFDANTFDEIHCIDVLEHTGSQGDWRFFFRQFDELYRILRHGGSFNCVAPRADSVWALGDPGHTRVIVEQQLTYLHRPAYIQIGKTPMTDYRGVFVSDWDIPFVDYTADHLRFQLVAVKPARTS